MLPLLDKSTIFATNSLLMSTDKQFRVVTNYQLLQLLQDLPHK